MMALILVTGASTGLGLATAQSLADEGRDVILHTRRADRVEHQSLLDRIHAVVIGDLADLDTVVGIAEEVNGLGRLDAVVHNAGVMHGDDVMATI